MKAYDYNRTITAGIKPEKGSVIISGMTKDHAEEMQKILPEGMPIYHFPSKKVLEENPDKKDQLVGTFKGKKAKELGITQFYEDSPIQAKIIKQMSPKTEVIVNNKNIVLIITDEWLAPDLALRIKNEGHTVLLACKRPTKILKGTITRVPYADRLEYAKDADLILYEDKSNKGEPVMLREQGYSVIGGSELSDRIELDRTWANEIAKSIGIQVPEMVNVKDLEEVKQIITQRGGRWVLKQQGKLDEIKGLNFVAKLPDSKDMLNYLDILQGKWIEGVKQDFVLQEFVDGYEVAVGSYWNGHEFMKDKDGDEICSINWEHKALFPGNLGESTGEQYTVMYYVKAKYCKLFLETLDKCRELLKKMDYIGDFDINTKVTEKGAFFLEFTPRLGVPTTSGHIEIHKSSWFNFFKAIADGTQDKNFAYDERPTIVSWLYTKPFPFVNSHKLTELYETQQNPTSMDEIADLMSFRLSNSENILVNFTKDFTKEDLTHLHMDGVKFDNGLKIANADGYIMTVSQQGDTVEEAGEKLEEILKKVIVPKAFWRNDFSKSNYHKSKEELSKWGYILSKGEEQKKADEWQQEKNKEEQKKQDILKEQKRREMRSRIKNILFSK